LREVKSACENFALLKLNRVAALCAVDCLLQIISGAYGDGFTGSGSVRHRAVHVDARQLRRAVELSLLSSRSSQQQKSAQEWKGSSKAWAKFHGGEGRNPQEA